MREPQPDVLSAPTTRDDKTMPMVVYGLFLAGLITGGLTSVVGVIIAYAVKEGSSELACSHYIFQIRTFWLSLVWALALGALGLIGLPLAILTFGLLSWAVAVPWGLLGLLGFWFLVRCILGLIYIARDEPYPRPRAWLF
jgi:uncharacterized membrane protein